MGTSLLRRCGFLPVLWRRLACKLSSAAAFAEDVSLEDVLQDKFKLLDTQGVHVDAAYASLLRQCGNAKALAAGKRVHGHMISTGRASNSYLGNLLVQMYGKCGSLKEARDAFGAISQRNVFSWSFMISAYAQQGHFREALDLFHRMDSDGVEPDCFVIASILGACSNLGDLQTGKDIHARILSGRLQSNVVVETALLNMYAKCGSLEDARRAFDAMQEKDVISWNAMVAAYAQHGHGRDAIELYHRMNWEGVQADEFTFSTILTACSSLGDLAEGKLVHSSILASGLQADDAMVCTLVNMYAKCGSLQNARGVFDQNHQRNVVTWTAMIAAYAQLGHGKEALKLYHRMNSEGVQPNNVTFTSVLGACSSIGEKALQQGAAIHAQLVDGGSESALALVQNALLNMYAKCGSLEDAKTVFDSTREQRDLFSWNAMLAAYAQHGQGTEALDLYGKMGIEGMEPDEVTFSSILGACASIGDLDEGSRIHAHVATTRFGSLPAVQTALVNMYAKCGNIKKARRFFFGVHPRGDLVSWNSMVAAYALFGHGGQALRTFKFMQLEGFQPNSITFISLLAACSRAGLVEQGRNSFISLSADYGMSPAVDHYRCMIDLLGRAGKLRTAEALIESMAYEPSEVEWTTLLGACRVYGNVEVGRRAAGHAIELNPSDSTPYVLLSNLNAAARRRMEARLKKRRQIPRGRRKKFREPPKLGAPNWNVSLKKTGKKKKTRELLIGPNWRASIKAQRAERNKFALAMNRMPTFASYVSKEVWTGT